MIVVPPRTRTGGGANKENAGTALSQRTGLNGFIREGLYGALQRWPATIGLMSPPNMCYYGVRKTDKLVGQSTKSDK